MRFEEWQSTEEEGTVFYVILLQCGGISFSLLLSLKLL